MTARRSGAGGGRGRKPAPRGGGGGPRRADGGRGGGPRGGRGGQRRSTTSGRRQDSRADGAGPSRRPATSKAPTIGGTRIEGRHAVRETLIAGRRVTELLVADDVDRSDVLADILGLASEAGVPIRRIPGHRIDAEAHTEAPQGVIATAVPLQMHDPLDLVGDVGRGRRLIVALDGVTDPHNLGAVIRTADGAGAAGVVLPRHRSARLTATAMKAAAGAAEYVPIAVAPGLPAALAALRDAGAVIMGLDEAGDTVLWEAPLEGEAPVVMVLGAEGRGLGRLVRERCDHVVTIPLAGMVPSLNVSVAAALACFEVARRR